MFGLHISAVVSQCLAHYKTPPGGLLVVHQWNYTEGNQPDAQHPTLRAALDSASTKVMIQLLGNDAHHSAFNSLALSQAKNAGGKTIGLSKATLARELAAYKALVGIDSSGEPNGAVNEDARYLINPRSMVYTDLEQVAEAPERLPQKLNSAGITAFMDAMASPAGIPIYDKLLARGKLTARIVLAQFYDPSRTRGADGNSTTRDSLAHLQLVNPADVERIGRDHLYVAFTYAWMNTDPDYDITVIPFFQKVHGNSHEALHPPGSYYEANTYPVRAVKAAGGILTAGSDAPVETNDPRPFINMSRAITRASAGQPALSPRQSITVREVIDAYTINGARMLNLQQQAGSIEVGKSADFIVLDRDILALADGGHPEKIAGTRILETWFQGNKVYAAATAPPR